MNTRQPTHPGEVLLEDIIKVLNITITEAAANLGVSRKALSELVNKRCGLTPEMAMRISQATNTTAESWMQMQMKLDLWKLHQEKTITATKFKNHDVA